MDLLSFLYGLARVPIWLDVAFSVDLQVLLSFRYGFANVSLRSCMALSMEFQGLLMDSVTPFKECHVYLIMYCAPLNINTPFMFSSP